MKKYAIICTRTEKEKEAQSSFDRLLDYLSRAKVEPVLMYDQESIFTGYTNGIKKIEETTSLVNNDIVIFCHDDIEILNDPVTFNHLLEQHLNDTKVGFVGPAGAAILKENAVWWDKEVWNSGGLRGLVIHGDYLRKSVPTTFGRYGDTIVLDGLFMAAKYKTIKQLDLKKPDSFVGNWDFYDLWYTWQAYQLSKAKHNKAVPLLICHKSVGMGATGKEWDESRLAFIKHVGLAEEIEKSNPVEDLADIEKDATEVVQEV